MTDEYVASLEKRLEELEQQRANLSYIIRPYFKILTRDDKVACLQLYVKIKHGIDPLKEWISAASDVVGVQPMLNYNVAVDVANMDDQLNLAGDNIVCHFEAIGDKTWNGMVFRPDDNKHYRIDDADDSEMKGIMLGLCGLSGLTYGSHSEPYISKEERMKPMVEEISKHIMEWSDKAASIGVSARGLWNVQNTFTNGSGK